MPRRIRFACGGFVYHVLNRGVGRTTLFHKDDDYAAFENVLVEAHDFAMLVLLTEGSLRLPDDWAAYVNGPQAEAELASLRRSVLRGCPYGDEQWQRRTAQQLGLKSTLRPRGRPRKRKEI